MKQTLLEIVQDILSDMDSDEVNSIGDTIESMQVAAIVRSTYNHIITTIDLPEHGSLIQLEGIQDLERPNYLRIPENVAAVKWIKYQDSSALYRDLIYLKPAEFVDIQLGREHLDVTTVVRDFSGGRLFIFNNQSPRYWTSFDDEHVIFDSYNADMDSTVHADKSICFGTLLPRFQLTDDYVPKLDAQFFPLLVSEAKSACFSKLKQVSSSTDDRQARRQRVRGNRRLHRSGQREGTYEFGPDFSRKHGYRRRFPTWH